MLIDAARDNNLDEVAKLLLTDCDVNSKDEDGMTALMWMACHDSGEGAAALLKANAKTKIKNSYGNTALIVAA